MNNCFRMFAKCLLLTLISVVTASAQEPGRGPTANRSVSVRIDPLLDTFRISPYIYGTNAQSPDRDENITARRIGGNRWTGYNWENNASNAGVDYLHQSDNYLTWDLPTAVQNQPAVAITAFHDTSVAMNAYSLVTLQAAGYVARDKAGPVSIDETAPGPRWRRVEFTKGASFSMVPDTADDAVYIDEEVNYLVSKYGGAASGRGIRGYSVDNEPALWPSTHPRIHPAKPTCREMIEKTTALASAVKAIDPDAEIFGPALYGYAAYRTLQDASDWNDYKSYGTFVDAYLASMQQAGTTAGRRLLDVLDLHWYPEARGKDDNGNPVRIILTEQSDSGVAYARMQAPRTLWDSSYVEDSWIGTFFSPVALLPGLNASIERNYPGTRLAVTEFNYGGDHHISGGIAVADVLGIFGRYNVYMSNYWGAVEGYVSSAYKIYRNYDGNGGTFGDINAGVDFDRTEDLSIYASRESGPDRLLHIVAINKNFTESIDADISIAGSLAYHGEGLFGFDAADSTVRRIGDAPVVDGNRLTYRIPPLSVVHLVLRPDPIVSGHDVAERGWVTMLDPVLPNPVHGTARVGYRLSVRSTVRLELVDLLGQVVRTLADGVHEPGRESVEFDTGSLPTGVYFCRLTAGPEVRMQGVRVVR